VSVLPVIVNPTSRGGRSRPPREAIDRAAASRGLRVEWWPTEAPGHATELAARAARDGHRMLAAWGGDGTYNEAALGLLNTPTALVILPGGSTSVLAYELGVSRDPVEALTSQLDGEPRAMAAARTDRGQVFLLMLSVGPDARILVRTPAWLKRRLGKLGIGCQSVLEFIKGDLPRFEVRMEGEVSEVAWCIVGNSRSYAGPYLATPGADPFSPGLEAVTLHRHGRTRVVPFFFAIFAGRHLRMRGVRRRPTTSIELCGSESIPYQLDGDPAGFLPVRAFSTDDRVLVLPPGESRGPGSGVRVP
jgi:diacylglycerol kinase family enzyme